MPEPSGWRSTGHLPVRSLGRSGITAPAVGIGCWAIGGPDSNLGLPTGWDSGADEGAAAEGLEAAWTEGARLFDTADIYGHGRSERLIGRLVAQVPRGSMVLTSKVGYFSGTAEHGFVPGHMRRQLEQTLENLRTDHLDVYFLHHSDFGSDDRWLAGAAQAMAQFRAEGLVRAVGMRGPHRFAVERVTTPKSGRTDKVARFHRTFDQVAPDVLAVRDNLLTPAERSAGIYSFASRHSVGVLVNKPLAQGLLTAPRRMVPAAFGPLDHRSRKRWFRADARALIRAGIGEFLGSLGEDDPGALLSVALWACLERCESAMVLVGFSGPEQVRETLAAARRQPPAAVIRTARAIMGDVQRRLDAVGEVFVDEALDPPRP